MTTKVTITAAPHADKAVKVTLSNGTVHKLTDAEPVLDVTLYPGSSVTSMEEVGAADEVTEAPAETEAAEEAAPTPETPAAPEAQPETVATEDEPAATGTAQ